MNRCANCGKYPFCTKIESGTGCCSDYIRRDRDTFMDRKINFEAETEFDKVFEKDLQECFDKRYKRALEERREKQKLMKEESTKKVQITELKNDVL